MNDIINNAIDFYVRQGRKIEVIRRYIRLKYKVSIDQSAFNERVKSLRLEYEVWTLLITRLVILYLSCLDWFYVKRLKHKASVENKPLRL